MVQRVHESNSAVGVDAGVVRFATLSDRTVYPPLNSFRRLGQRLAFAQCAQSRKKKFSNNWKKAKKRIQKIHALIANARRDFLHKVSASISKNHAIVAVEDLQVKNMSASAAETVEEPGKNVQQKAGLNKPILDQAWSEFFRQLGYKLSWAGGQLVPVPPANTSRTCPHCTQHAKENRTTRAKFKCVVCWFEENADLVASNNILARGIARLRNEGRDVSTLRQNGSWFYLHPLAQIACCLSQEPSLAA